MTFTVRMNLVLATGIDCFLLGAAIFWAGWYPGFRRTWGARLAIAGLAMMEFSFVMFGVGIAMTLR